MCLHSIPQVECLEWILDHGGSIHDRDNLGGTPVHDAAEQGQVRVAVYWIQHQFNNLHVWLYAMVTPGLTGDTVH